jgi:predicted transcriptional regulator
MPQVCDLFRFVSLSPLLSLSVCLSVSCSEFRTLGLRHMVVINNNHQVVGIITRKDITNKTLRAHWEAQVGAALVLSSISL